MEKMLELVPSGASIVAIVVTLIVVKRLMDRSEAKAKGAG